MAAGKRTYAAATYDLGAVSEGAEGSLIVQVENLTGSVAVHGRSVGSGMARVVIEGHEHDDSATPVVSIAAAGLYKFPCGGLDLALVVTTGPADISTNFVAG
jgi:hypothetical protein